MTYNNEIEISKYKRWEKAQNEKEKYFFLEKGIINWYVYTVIAHFSGLFFLLVHAYNVHFYVGQDFICHYSHLFYFKTE